MNWNKEIEELESFFLSAEIPKGDLKIDRATTIKDVKKFLDSSFGVVKHNNGNNTYLPYLARLYKLKMRIEYLNKPVMAA